MEKQLDIIQAQAKSRTELFSKINTPNVKDITSAWKKAGSPAPDAENDEFFTFFNKQQAKSGLTEGGVIFVEAIKAVENKKPNPYKMEKVVADGTKKFTTMFQIEEVGTKTIFGNYETRKLALDSAKKMYADGFTGSLKIQVVKLVTEGNPIIALMTYAPTVGTQSGMYFLREVHPAKTQDLPIDMPEQL